MLLRAIRLCFEDITSDRVRVSVAVDGDGLGPRIALQHLRHERIVVCVRDASIVHVEVEDTFSNDEIDQAWIR